MPKQINMDDDSSLYQPLKEQTEKEKLREMNFQGKLNYLWEYYKWYAIGAIAIVALIIYFIYSILNPAIKPQFYAAMINNTIDNHYIQQYSDDFEEHLQLNLKRESVELNTTFNFGVDDQYTFSMTQALTTYISSSEVDVIIAPESIFKGYAYGGTFKKLSDELPTDIYSSLTNQFYISDIEDDKEKNVYGIYLTDTPFYKEYAINTDPYILGIVINAPHEDNTIEFIRTLFKIK